MTGFRWRKRGWIEILNIGGKLYVADDEIQRFINRSKQGEFFRRTLEGKTTAKLKREIKEGFEKC